MTKAELINEVANDLGMDRATVSHVFENLVEQIKFQMIEGHNIYIRGFGTFNRTTRKQKKARNISKNTEVIIPSRVQPTFKACKTFKDSVTKAAKRKGK